MVLDPPTSRRDIPPRVQLYTWRVVTIFESDEKVREEKAMPPAAPAMVASFSAGFSGDTMGEKLRTYFAIETAWWVGVYAICYRFQPTIAIMRTGAGRAAVHRAGEWLQRMWPSRYESIAKASERGFASPNGRTFGEWLLINKILAPFSFPLKLAAANRIVNQKRAAVAAWTLSGGSLALSEGSDSGSSSSDLVKGTGVAGP